MLSTQTHIIRRQNVKIHATTHDAFALKRQIELLMEDLTPKLASLFDGLVAENEWLQINTLDIHVEDLAEHELEEKLSERILSSIADKIDKLKYNSSSSVDDDSFGFQVLNIGQKTISAFLYFLKNGILPWWYESGSHTAFEESISIALEQLGSTIKDSESFQTLINIRSVSNSTEALKRLAEQFTDQVYWKLIKVLAVGSSVQITEIEEIFERLSDILKSKNLSGRIQNQAKTALIMSLSRGNSTDEINNGQVSTVYKLLQSASLIKIQRLIRDDEMLKKYLSGEHEFISIDNTLDSAQGFENKEFKKENSQKENSGRTGKKDAFLNELKQADGAIISNAGLVIVAPFLPELFKQCGILTENTIMDINKAVAILHYTVFGNCQYREYDVLFNKVLCGLEGNEVIEILNELSEAEKNEVETMLSTAISYWDVLKSTSPDGLREGFLIRKGNLLHKYDDWFLQVEQSAIDALLQHLPWTIGFIKLPWMKTMIRTQWV